MLNTCLSLFICNFVASKNTNMLDKWRPFNKRNHGKDKYIEEALAIFEDCAIKRGFAIDEGCYKKA